MLTSTLEYFVIFLLWENDDAHLEGCVFWLFALFLSVDSWVSSSGASLVEAAVFGLSSGFSEASTTVVSLLELQPMI